MTKPNTTTPDTTRTRAEVIAAAKASADSFESFFAATWEDPDVLARRNNTAI